jgi:oligopeptide/dipeptide ABC transporter ATP-binding protein
MKNDVLGVKDLCVDLKFGDTYKPVVRGVDFTVGEGEILGILGESGSGKSVTIKSILGLMPNQIMRRRGIANFSNLNLIEESDRSLQKVRGRDIGFVFQNSNSAMNHYKSIEAHFKETYKVHRIPYDRDGVISLLKKVGIEDPKTLLMMYPHQLSGGLSQRVGIGLALCHNPKIIIADEPTSAIDASLRSKILQLFKDVNKEYGTAIILITHDFDVAIHYCDKVAIMYGGVFFEYGKTSDVLKNPMTPYASALKTCAESLHKRDQVLYQLEGYPPSPLEFKDNCPFMDRCSQCLEVCGEKMPEMISEGNRGYRCWNPNFNR